MSLARMTDQQARVSQLVIEQESQNRQHLVVHLSGAHAYGFPSPDSDLDLKAIHITPTRELLGLDKPEIVSNRLEFVDNVEVDYTSNELKTGVGGLLKGDGNMLERVLSKTPVLASPELAELKQHATSNLSRCYYQHYRGFAATQAKAVLESKRPTAKKLLYVLRTALTGTHLLLQGECEPDVTQLYSQYNLSEVPELIAIKQAAESSQLDTPWIDRLDGIIKRAFDQLAAAYSHSTLPEQPLQRQEFIDWMLDLRLN